MDNKLTRKEERLLLEADQREALDKAWDKRLVVLIFGSGIGAAAVVLVQVTEWLKTGNWPSYTLATLGIEAPDTSWLGLNEVLQYLLDAPLALDILIVFYILVHIFTRNDQRPISEDLRNAQMKRARLKQTQENDD